MGRFDRSSANGTAFDYDLVVVGGGPAGALCSTLAKRQNPDRRILVLERARFPRHHVGEVILPNFTPILRRAGVLEKLQAETPINKIGIVYNWGPPGAGETWTADFRERDGRTPEASWHVNRAIFDRVLLDHAASVGVEVAQGARVHGIEPLDGRTLPTTWDSPNAGMRVAWIDSTGDSRTTTTEFVADASGQARFLTTHWRMPVHPRLDMNNFALYGYWTHSGIHETHWPVGDNQRWAVIGTCDLGWIWHIPIDLDLVSVGLVTDRETLRRAGRDELSALYLSAVRGWQNASLLERATWLGGTPDGTRPNEPSVVSDWACHAETLCGPGWYLVGDSGVFVDPILSSGIQLASQGAVMVANALTTGWCEPDADAKEVCEGLTRRYTALADTYHRMARVWYRRNARGQTWHWQALQERLQAGGDALHEREADAFTAICQGSVVDPLENAVRPEAPIRVAFDLFTTITARRLFDDHDALENLDPLHFGTEARAEIRRSFLKRWNRLSRSALRLDVARCGRRRGFHTSMEMDRWVLIEYVELVLRDPTGSETLAFPTLGHATEQVLRCLDGSRGTRETVRRAMTGLPVGVQSRDIAVHAMASMLAHLDMLRVVESITVDERPPFAGHPFVTVLLESALRAARRPCVVAAEFDWLAETVVFSVDDGGHRHRYQAADAALVDPRLFPSASSTTAIRQLDQFGSMNFIEALVARLRDHERRERRTADLWAACRPFAALTVEARWDAGEAPALRPICV